MSAPSIRRHTLNIRIGPEERDLIDRGAKAQGKTRTDFCQIASKRSPFFAHNDDPFHGVPGRSGIGAAKLVGGAQPR